MLRKALLFGLLTAAVVAVPTPEAETDPGLDDAHEELEMFKRDSILDARDLELAEVHGVNLTEMYKHSLIKRSDEDHIIIWVDRRYVNANEYEVVGGSETDEEDLIKRQGTRIGKDADFEKWWISDWCRDHKRQDHTGPNGPYSGGVQAMYQWARAHSGGYFEVVGQDWQNLIVAGSNSGANALYRAKSVRTTTGRLGTMDLRNDADWTQNRARKFGSSWRASSKGGETCDINVRLNYEIIRTKYDV